MSSSLNKKFTVISRFPPRISSRNPSVQVKRFGWLHPDAEVGPSLIVSGQRGLIARSPIKRGGVIVVMGGQIVDIATHNQIGRFAENYGMDIAEDFSFCPKNEAELEMMPQCFINHSCEPNAGFLDQLRIVAIRDIGAGEEIAYDYAFLLYGNPRNRYEFRIDCTCGSPACRRVITVHDWKIRELQEGYGRWFQPFLREKFA